MVILPVTEILPWGQVALRTEDALDPRTDARASSNVTFTLEAGSRSSVRNNRRNSGLLMINCVTSRRIAGGTVISSPFESMNLSGELLA